MLTFFQTFTNFARILQEQQEKIPNGQRGADSAGPTARGRQRGADSGGPAQYGLLAHAAALGCGRSPRLGAAWRLLAADATVGPVELHPPLGVAEGVLLQEVP